MSKYRRMFVTGGTYFFTLVTHERQPLFVDPRAVKLLGQVLRDCRRQWPFETVAMVVMPDHLHAIWNMPRGDTKYSQRWGWIKKEFSKAWRALGNVVDSPSMAAVAERRLAVWQRRFWEHTIRDEDDFDQHFHYVHYNPVKHGYVDCPGDWLSSTFHRWVACGVYPMDWGCVKKSYIPDFQAIKDTVGEKVGLCQPVGQALPDECCVSIVCTRQAEPDLRALPISQHLTRPIPRGQNRCRAAGTINDERKVTVGQLALRQMQPPHQHRRGDHRHHRRQRKRDLVTNRRRELALQFGAR